MRDDIDPPACLRMSERAAEDQDSSKDRRQIPSRQGGKGRDSGGKEVISPVAKKLYKVFQAATALYERAYSGISVGMSGLRLRQTRNDAN